jgi:DNA-binding CsgD family transcriptional regulator
VVSATAFAPSDLLEREQVLRRLTTALGPVREGHGGIALVEGPAGIGKTAVLAALRGAATADGLRVLRARGALLEREFAFGVVRQLLEPPLAALDDAGREDLLQGAAGLAAAALGLGSAAAEEALELAASPSFPVLHGLYWLCANLAARRPLLLVVDDLQWADLPSLRFLAFLMPRLEELPVALLGGVRTGELDPAEPAGMLLATLATDPATEAVRPAPLTADGVAALIGRRLRSDVDPAFAAACHEATGGLPFLVGELAEELRERGVTPTAAAAQRLEGLGAATIGRWVLVRLGRLGDDAGALARALAVVESGELAPVASLAELPAPRAAAAADALVAAGIAAPGRPLQFAHPIVRAAIYGELAPAERERRHRRAAELLDDPQRAAEHLLAVAPARDPWVVERLAAVSADAVRRGAPESAAAYLRRALDEPADGPARPELLVACGAAEESVGDARWHAHCDEALRLAADDATRAGVALYLSYALGRHQRFAASVAVIERTLEAMDDPDSPEALLLEAASAAVGCISPATAGIGRRRMQHLRALTATDRDVPAFVTATAAYGTLIDNAPVGEALALARRAVRQGGSTQRPTDPPWLVYVVITLIYAGAHAEAIGLLDGAIADAQRAGDGVTFGAYVSTRALANLRRGDLSAAEEDGRAAATAGDPPVPGFYRVLGAASAVEALVERDRLADAEALLARVSLLVDEPNSVVTLLVGARGRLRAAQGRLDLAAEDFREAGALMAATSELCPSHVPWRGELATVLLAQGRGDEARALADEELELARASGAPRVLGGALRAAGAAVGGDAGLALLQEAVAVLEDADSVVLLARALCDLGAALRRANRRAEAREPLRRALALAQEAGAARVAAAAAIELRATGARPRNAIVSGVASLTASERRVAEHAARGLTNREIAQTLFVTSRTVEGHLTNVFRKLDVGSREELAGALDVSAAA